MNATDKIAILLIFGLLVSLSSPVTNISQEEDDPSPQTKYTGLFLSRIDGHVDKTSQTGYISEWGDAHTEIITLKGVEEEIKDVHLSTKVVVDRVLIGLIVPLHTVTIQAFREIQITFDTNPDGFLSNGDARVAYNILSGESSLTIFDGGVFVTVISDSPLDLRQSDAVQLKTDEVTTMAANVVDNELHVEFDFSLGQFSKTREHPVTILGTDFGFTAFGIILFGETREGKQSVSYGFPGSPQESTQDGITEYVVDSFKKVPFIHDLSVLPPAFFTDVGVENIEVTQSIQTFNNDLRLVKGKTSMARVYINNPTDSKIEVEVRLTAFHDNGGGGVFYRGTLTQSYTAQPYPYRFNLDNTANFILPSSWIQPPFAHTLKLKAEVTVPGKIDSNSSDNIYIDNFFFGDTYDMNIYYIQINEGTVSDPDLISNSDRDPKFIRQALEDFRVLYPSANPRFIELDWQTIGVWTGTPDELKARLNELASTMILSRLVAILLGASPEDLLPIPDQIFGFRTSGSGSSTPAWSSAGWTLHYGAWGGLHAKRGPGVLAHEVNHNIGGLDWGRHVPGCDAAGPDPSWPFPNSQSISQLYSDSMGWHSIINELVKDNYDFMSYCMGGSYTNGDTYPDDPQFPITWVSDFRWEKLYDDLLTFSPGNPQPRHTTNVYVNDLIDKTNLAKYNDIAIHQAQGSTRVISGFIEKDMQGRLNPTYTVDGEFNLKQTATVENPTHYLEINYNDGSTKTYPIEVGFGENHDDGIHPSPESIGFTFWAPENGDIKEIYLLDVQGNILDGISKSSYNLDNSVFDVPTNYHRGMSTQLSVKFDSNNRTLLYSQLQYSSDGHMWLDFGPQTTSMSTEFNMSYLPGGDVSFRFRITDGFDTKYVHGTNSVHIESLEPTIVITNPYPKMGGKNNKTNCCTSVISQNAVGYVDGKPITDPHLYVWKLYDDKGNIISETSGQLFETQIFEPGIYKLDLAVANYHIPLGDLFKWEWDGVYTFGDEDHKGFTEAILEHHTSEISSVSTDETDVTERNETGTNSETSPELALSFPSSILLAAMIIHVLLPRIVSRKQ